MTKYTPKNADCTISFEDYNALLEELQATKHKLYYYETLVETIPMPIFAKNEDAKFSVLNKAYEDFFGVEKERLLNISALEMQNIPHDARIKLHEENLHTISNTVETHYETTFDLDFGTTTALYWSKGFATPQTGEKGLVGIIVDNSIQKNLENILEDTVKDLRKSQKKIEYSNERMQLMLDTMPLATQIWSKDHELLESSNELARIFNFASPDEYKLHFTKLHPKFQANGQESLQRITTLLNEALQNGTARSEWLHQDLTGRLIPFDISYVRSSLHGETVILAFLKDLTEYHATIEKLQDADNYTKLMLDASPFGTLIWDKDFQLIDCNKALAKNFGLNESSEFVEYFPTLIPEFQPNGTRSLDLMLGKLQEAFTYGASSTYWVGIGIDGIDRPSEVSVVRIKYRNEYMVIGYVKDLREVEENRKKAQMAEERTNAILNGVPLGISIITPEFKILDCNHEAVKLSGYESKEKLIHNFLKIFPHRQPDGSKSIRVIKEKLKEVRQCGHSRFELYMVDAQQHCVPYEIHLVHAYLQQEELYIGYAKNLLEFKEMLHDIEVSREIAEKSASAKSEFLANMSHEIRTPMNGILGLLHILSNTELSISQQNYLEKALFSTNELLRIINDILDFSKIEAGKLEMEVTTFTLHDICSEVESLFGHLIEKKRLSFKLIEGEFATTKILGDPLRLKQVLSNLISNAIKFTQKGEIGFSIECQVHQDTALHCRFSIKDTGIGLSQEQIEGLFTAFSQADTSVTRKFGGTGLGLAISKRIVEMMQGDIWVESVQDEGSTFIFTTIFDLSSQKEFSAPEQLAQLTASQHSIQAHLLLVEDNQINQLIAEELLKNAGYSVDIANNGQEGVKMLEEKAYDLVLMDIQMPIMDGLTATQKIRENPQFSNLPIIAMSAHAMTGDKEKSLKHGMNDHITKPISPNILYQTLTYWLRKNT